MSLTSININRFRNLSEAKLDLNNQCNIFYGENGSGKTSFLEAVHYLILGRSFRTHILRRIINRDSNEFSLFGKIKHENSSITIGTSRSTKTGKNIKINGKSVVSSLEITKLLPLQLLNHDSYSLLYEGPKIRRQFIDWGLFHVEQLFLDLWRKVERTLGQRNMAIRSRSGIENIQIWDKQLAELGNELHQYRQKYIEEFIPIAQETLKKLLPDFSIDLSYSAGWDQNLDLETVLLNSIDRDLHLGYTSCGPHRANIQIVSGKIPVKDLLSRGQQKMLIYGLQIAQGIMINKLTGKKTIYLVDDLLAELDFNKCELLASTLLKLEKTQIFVTGLVRQDLEKIFSVGSNDKKIFHLENNLIN